MFLKEDIKLSNSKDSAGIGVVSVKFIFRALRFRNYRLFFIGQSLSLIGTWMQLIALSWLVYRLTHSPFLLGVTAFASSIPTFLFSLFTGALTDRWNRYYLLILAQTLAMAQAALLTFMYYSGSVKVSYIILLSLFSGVVNSIDVPARQSFMIDIVEDKKDLGNALALNSLMFNSARLIGPSVAGVLVSIKGEGLCFLINTVSYLAVIISLLIMKIKPLKMEKKPTRILDDIKEGFSYAFGNPLIKFTISLVAVLSLIGLPYAVLMPVFAKEVLKGDAHTLGFLMASIGIGAIAGALFLAGRKSSAGLGGIIPFATLMFGSGLFIFGLSRVFLLSLLLMPFVGFGMMVQMVASNTLIQSNVADDKRGRVMSFYSMAFMGMAPFGNLLAGAVADRIGAPLTMMINGAVCAIGAIFFITKMNLFQDTSGESAETDYEITPEA